MSIRQLPPGSPLLSDNFQSRTTVPDLYKEKPGWIYSAKEDWDKGIAGACSESNCALNGKCISKPFGNYSCVLSDCGIPSGEGFSMHKVQEWDAIGISRRIHITCSLGYKKQGSERFVCLSDGTWKTDLICCLEACPVRYTEMLSNSSRACLRFVATPATYPNASRNCTSDGGDLIKIDTQTMLLNFLAFISTHVAYSKKIWIQGIKDDDSVWRFHNSTTMPDFLRQYMYVTTDPEEIHLRYVISYKQFWDREPHYNFSYICEYRCN